MRIIPDHEKLFASTQFTNSMLYDVLPDNAWHGKPCFIVGGGPSLKDFDWQLLKGRRTIGVNRAFEKFDPTIIFSMDTRFLNWMVQGEYARSMADGAAMHEKFKKSRAYKVWLATYTLSLPKEFFIVKVRINYDYGIKAFTYKMTDGIGHGNNSGYAALNLAVCLGADPIYLLGFDCKHENGRSHWHAGHPIPQAPGTATEFIKFFERAAAMIRPKNIRVINLNPNSALKCFLRQPYEEVLQ